MSGILKPLENILRPRFGMRSLLLFVAICAVLIGGFRIGYDRGYRSGEARKARETVVVKIYYVDDLVRITPGGAGASSLMELITSTVAPHTWEDVGGVGRIHVFPHPGDERLVIAQSLPAHDDISKLLAILRANAIRQGKLPK